VSNVGLRGRTAALSIALLSVTHFGHLFLEWFLSVFERRAFLAVGSHICISIRYTLFFWEVIERKGRETLVFTYCLKHR
jgi:hypothetical protein